MIFHQGFGTELDCLLGLNFRGILVWMPSCACIICTFKKSLMTLWLEHLGRIKCSVNNQEMMRCIALLFKSDLYILNQNYIMPEIQDKRQDDNEYTA